jgi:hypothetical protein
MKLCDLLYIPISEASYKIRKKEIPGKFQKSKYEPKKIDPDKKPIEPYLLNMAKQRQQIERKGFEYGFEYDRSTGLKDYSAEKLKQSQKEQRAGYHQKFKQACDQWIWSKFFSNYPPSGQGIISAGGSHGTRTYKVMCTIHSTKVLVDMSISFINKILSVTVYGVSIVGRDGRVDTPLGNIVAKAPLKKSTEFPGFEDHPIQQIIIQIATLYEPLERQFWDAIKKIDPINIWTKHVSDVTHNPMNINKTEVDNFVESFYNNNKLLVLTSLVREFKRRGETATHVVYDKPVDGLFENVKRWKWKPYGQAIGVVTSGKFFAHFSHDTKEEVRVVYPYMVMEPGARASIRFTILHEMRHVFDWGMDQLESGDYYTDKNYIEIDHEKWVRSKNEALAQMNAILQFIVSTPQFEEGEPSQYRDETVQDFLKFLDNNQIIMDQFKAKLDEDIEEIDIESRINKIYKIMSSDNFLKRRSKEQLLAASLERPFSLV